MFLVLCSLAILQKNIAATEGYGICGVWQTENGQANIRIYRSNGFFYGISVPSLHASVADAERSRQFVILRRFVAKSHVSQYVEGTIYDPQTKMLFRGVLKQLSENRLLVRGYIGFTWLGGSTEWSLVEKRSCSVQGDK